MRSFLDFRLKGCAALAVALSAMSACDGQRDVRAVAAPPTLTSGFSATQTSEVTSSSAPRVRRVKRTLRVVHPTGDAASRASRSSVRAAYIQSIQATAGPAYRPQQSGSELVLLENAKQGLHAELQPQGARFLVDSDGQRHHAAFRLSRYGCETGSSGATREAVRPSVRGERVVFSRDNVSEWYKNGPLGVEQGFDLAARPACAEDGIVLEMDLDSDLRPASVERDGATHIELRTRDGQAALRYSDLFATDEDGKTLPARMTLSGRKLALHIGDRGARYPLHVDPMIWAQIRSEIKPTSPTSLADDGFGTSIALSGDTAIVGAPFTDEGDLDYGSAFIFTRTAPGQWVQGEQLLIGSGTPNANYGYSVAIGTDTATGRKRVVVGAPGDAVSGTATILLFDGTTWNVEETFIGPSGTDPDGFGTSVGVFDDRVIVGAPGTATNDGYVTMFEMMAGSFTQVGIFPGTAGAGERYGFTVAIDGTLAVAGAPTRAMPSTNGGGYDAFRRIGTTWTKTSVLGSTGTDRRAGTALAVSGDTVIDGIVGDNGVGTAYVDTYDAAGVMTSGAQLTLPNGTLATGDMFGNAVAISGNLAIVGAAARNGQAGDAYVFANMGGTWTWQPPAITRKTTTAAERFGHSVAISSSGTYAIVGAPGNDTTAANSGAFYDIIQRKGNGESCAADLECGSDFCIDGYCCNTACGRTGIFGSEPKTDCQSCRALDTGGTDGTCAALNIPMQCRAAADLCDRASFCQLGNMACPPNPPRTAGTICRAAGAGNLCDAPEACDGVNPSCPADVKRASGFVCRAAAGLCDAVETCDGTADTCPADAKMNVGTPCRMAAAGDLCDRTEVCDGTTNGCPADQVQPAGAACRAAKDECDSGEICDGTSKSCPFDGTQPDGLVCATGTCQFGACRAEADLELSISANPQVTRLTEPVTVTVTVQNRGPAAAAQVEVRLTANDGATISNPMGSGWSCAIDNGAATCTRPDLPANQAANFTLTLAPPIMRVQFSVSGAASSMTYDQEPGNNTATALVRNENPGNPVLAGGGIGCSTTQQKTNAAAPALFALAICGLLLRRRRSAQ